MHIFIYVYMYTCTCIHAYMYIYLRSCIYIRTCIYICTYIYTCIYIGIYVYICTRQFRFDCWWEIVVGHHVIIISTTQRAADAASRNVLQRVTVRHRFSSQLICGVHKRERPPWSQEICRPAGRRYQFCFTRPTFWDWGEGANFVFFPVPENVWSQKF